MSTKQIGKSEIEIQIPDDVKVNLKGSMLHVQGPLGNVYKNFKKIPVLIEINDNKILLKKTGERKKHRAILNTSKSLIQTLCIGVVDGFTIKMKIVYSHFPITVKAEEKTTNRVIFQFLLIEKICKYHLEIHDDLNFLPLILIEYLQRFVKHLLKLAQLL